MLVLERLDGAQAVDPLVTALEDADSAVRLKAIQALLRIRDRRAREPLRRLAASEADPAVREAAAKAAVELSRDERLVAHWSFDDRSAQVARDMTGRGSDGQITGCEPVEGKVGRALEFRQGSSIALGRPAGLPIANRPLTITAWVKSEAENGVVVARGGAFCGFSLYIKDTTARLGIHREQEGPAYIAAGDASVVGSWVHLAGVVKEDCIEVYVNGQLAGCEKTPGYIPGDCGQGMEIGYDAGNSPAEIVDHFVGLIDEVRIYHAALTGEEIAKQYRSENRTRS